MNLTLISLLFLNKFQKGHLGWLISLKRTVRFLTWNRVYRSDILFTDIAKPCFKSAVFVLSLYFQLWTGSLEILKQKTFEFFLLNEYTELLVCVRHLFWWVHRKDSLEQHENVTNVCPHSDGLKVRFTNHRRAIFNY